jgi:hypothetical protein
MLNGPFGRGQTIGKMALRIRVRDYAGEVISWRQAVVRTIVLFPTFVTVPVVGLFISGGASFWSDFIAGVLTHNIFLGVLVATLLVIPFNPFRQGLHDFAAKTLVGGAAPDEAVTFTELTEKIGPGWVPFHRQPQYSGVVTALLVVVLQGVMMNPWNFTEEQEAYMKNIYLLSSNPGFAKSAPMYAPMEESLYKLAAGPDAATDAPADVAEDDTTTGPLRLVLQVSRDMTWNVDMATSEGMTLGRNYISNYHEKVLPIFLSYVGSSKDEQAKARVLKWYDREISYRLLLVQGVGFTPYPPLYREQSEGVFSFPPITRPETSK